MVHEHHAPPGRVLGDDLVAEHGAGGGPPELLGVCPAEAARPHADELSRAFGLREVGVRRLPGIVEDDGPHGAIVGAARRRAPARLRARGPQRAARADRAGRESGDGPEHVEAVAVDAEPLHLGRAAVERVQEPASPRQRHVERPCPGRGGDAVRVQQREPAVVPDPVAGDRVAAGVRRVRVAAVPGHDDPARGRLGRGHVRRDRRDRTVGREVRRSTLASGAPPNASETIRRARLSNANPNGVSPAEGWAFGPLA